MNQSKSEEDTQPVISYRLGQLEKTVETGFTSIHKKIDDIGKSLEGFVKHEDLTEAIVTATKLHEDHENRIRANTADIDYAKGALKVMYALLTLMAMIIGALWWIKA